MCAPAPNGPAPEPRHHRFVSPAALAEALGVCTRTLSRMAARGVIPPPVFLSANTKRWDYEAVIAALHGWQQVGR